MAVTALNDFMSWRNRCEGGDRHEYHRGNLSIDAYYAKAENRVSTLPLDEVRDVQAAVVEAYRTGAFELIQQRHGDNDYSYFIVRRHRPTKTTMPWKKDYLGKELSDPRSFVSGWSSIGLRAAQAAAE